MYAGKIVEIGLTTALVSKPGHPYTRALVAASPALGDGLPEELPGEPPKLDEQMTGCAFAPRCRLAVTSCATDEPELVNGIACPIVERA
jgi:oligopeptide/dipeptide ABC transporter ATP-binding protein